MNQNQKHGEANTRTADWFQEGKVNELMFLENIRNNLTHFRYSGGRFYDQEEHVMDDSEVQDIFLDMLKPYVTTGLYKLSSQLLALAKIRWRFESFSSSNTLIHLQNGTLNLCTMELEERQFTLYRLPVCYNPDAKSPVNFLRFLHDLLEEEDILTLQEYVGYCLRPCTDAQKMLMLVGRGGEGKSTLGHVLAMLFGEQAVMGSIQKICTNRFARADLEGKLLVIDDDMSMDALPETSYLKTLVTLKGKTDLERKGKQSYQGVLYARFLGFSNGSLSALYDRSEGFYRRQLILTCKERPKDRIDYVNLEEQMRAELDGILIWALVGLARLVGNDYRFTVSAQTRKNLDDARRDANSAMEFLESEGYISYDRTGCASSRALYNAYRTFCEDNSLHPISNRSFLLYLKQQQRRLGITYTSHLPTEPNRSIRGYEGIRIVPGHSLRMIG